MNKDTFPAALVEAVANGLPEGLTCLRPAPCNPDGCACMHVAQRALSALPAAVQAVARGEAVAVPRNVETDAPEMLEEMRRAMRAVRLSGVCGMSIDAQWRYEYARESAGYRAMLAASPYAHEPPR